MNININWRDILYGAIFVVKTAYYAAILGIVYKILIWLDVGLPAIYQVLTSIQLAVQAGRIHT